MKDMKKRSSVKRRTQRIMRTLLLMMVGSFVFTQALNAETEALLPVVPPVEAESSTPALDSKTKQKVRIPSMDRMDPMGLNVQVGLGSSIQPGLLWLHLRADVQVDRFLSIGPNVQLGFGEFNRYTITGLGPRLHLPIGIVNWALGVNVGASYRDVKGASFWNFAYQIDTAVDMFFTQNISLGIGGGLNVLSSVAEEATPYFNGLLTFHF